VRLSEEKENYKELGLLIPRECEKTNDKLKARQTQSHSCVEEINPQTTPPDRISSFLFRSSATQKLFWPCRSHESEYIELVEFQMPFGCKEVLAIVIGIATLEYSFCLVLLENGDRSKELTAQATGGVVDTGCHAYGYTADDQSRDGGSLSRSS
jgi:hypothetical protein